MKCSQKGFHYALKKYLDYLAPKIEMKFQKMTQLIALLFLSTFIFSCQSATQQAQHQPDVEKTKTSQDIFFERFKTLEGQRFLGKEVYIQEGRESWAHLEMEMYVREWKEDVVYIPFRLADNSSRTWTIYRQDDNRLWLRHDHRHEDGTPEDINMYGGFSSDKSDAQQQFFPADDYTCKLISYACENEWILRLKEDLTVFSYILEKSGVRIIQIDFDLTQPVVKALN